MSSTEAVLAAHQWSHTATTHCSCGFRTPLAQLAVEGYLAHVADALAPIITERERAAAGEALHRAADVIDGWKFTGEVVQWLRDRADRRHAQDNPGPAQAPDSRQETER